LIRKWLKAGILEPDGKVINPLTGTPQGGIVSPILGNVYLHYVLDLWIEKRVKFATIGAVKYVRYADDFVCAFGRKEEADRFYAALPGRLGKFGLEVAEEKTRTIQFGRWDNKGRQKVDFLGFELYWGKMS
jgi:retron-type reverse transcriptase